jgi:hypothetical protein
VVKINLKKGIKPFRYPKLGKVWLIDNGVEIPEKLLKNLKKKVKKAEVENGK